MQSSERFVAFEDNWSMHGAQHQFSSHIQLRRLVACGVGSEENTTRTLRWHKRPTGDNIRTLAMRCMEASIKGAKTKSGGNLATDGASCRAIRPGRAHDAPRDLVERHHGLRQRQYRWLPLGMPNTIEWLHPAQW